MNRREQESIEVRVSRVGGEMADLLDFVKRLLPDEYASLMEHAKTMNDEMRRVRRVAEKAVGRG